MSLDNRRVETNGQPHSIVRSAIQMLRGRVLDPQLLGTEKAITVPAEMVILALCIVLPSHAGTLE